MVATFDYYPFDSGLGANSTETRWRNMMHYMKSTGIIAQGSVLDTSSDDCAVTAGTGMTVNIATGKAWVRGHMFEHTGTSASLSIANNSSGSTRTDLVVIRNDFVGNTIQYQVLQGTTTPVQSSTTWDLPLATVAVPNGAASSSSFTITDKRVFATPKALVPSAKKYHATNPSIAAGVWANINIASTYWLTQDSMYLVADPTKIFITQDGFYSVGVHAGFPNGSGGTGARGVRIIRNGNSSDILTIDQGYASTGATNGMEVSSSGIAQLFLGDYIQAQAIQSTGASMALNSFDVTVHWVSSVSIS